MTLQTNKLRDAILLAFAASATLIAGTGATFAQDQDQSQDQSTSASDTKAKTLDRIEVTGSRLKRAEIEGALPVTVIDRAQIDASGEVSVADYLRTTNFSSNGQFRPQSGSSAQAGAFANLRGLGGQRTLVLIDGHRAPKAPFSAGSGSDLNAIPLAAVERIEVLTDGASAVYGADAVGGVINIITRKDYNGAQITVDKSTPKWGPTDSASILFGISGDRGHMVGGFSENRRAMIYTHDRPWGQKLGNSTYGNNYTSVDPVTGAVITVGGVKQLLQPIPGGCTNANFSINPANGRCVYNFNAVAADEASYGNKSFFLNGELQINDNWSTYMSTTVVNTKSFGRYAPVPGVVRLDETSPANPNPGSITYLYHRFAAVGTRDTNTDSNVYDILLGFRGAVNDNIDADFGVRYNTYHYNELGHNYVVGSLAEQAISNGSYNLQDPGATPADVLKSISITIARESFFTTKEAYGNLTFNDLFQMGGGGASLAVGGEFRKETYADLYDPLSEAGVVLGSAGNSSGGGREVSAVYGEMLLPFTSTLEADIAGRYEKYSDFGSNFAPKIALRWHPIDSLTLRGSVGKGFVAPTLDVITQKTAYSADPVNDPATCVYYSQDTVAKCTGGGSFNQTQVDAYRENAAGLGAEKSTQFSLGVVWDATDWMNVTLDYWNIKIKDRIAFYSSQKLINIDLGTDPTPFPGAPCALIRDPAKTTPYGNAIDEIHNCYFNEGEVKTDGIDLTLRTNFDLNDWGKINSRLLASYSHKYTIDGGVDQTGLAGFPAVRATLNNQWQKGDWSAGLDARYIGRNGNLPHFTTYDVQASLELPWNAKATFGVNNFTNKLPVLEDFGGRPFNFFLYDAYGRTPYIRYEQRF